MGVFFITGNHEYFSGEVEDWCNQLRQWGIQVLRNEHKTLEVFPKEQIVLAGVDDFDGGRFSNTKSDIKQALDGRNPEHCVILLAHQPRSILEASVHQVDLQLSGHTHAGQIWPHRYLVRLQQPFVAGLHKVNQTVLYISAGTGFWGPPLRIFAPSELTEISLFSI